MKLAQFRLKGSEERRAGVLAEGKLVDIARAARSVPPDGSRPLSWRPADWLLEVSGVLDIINRGGEALGEINRLVEFARTRGALDAGSGGTLDDDDVRVAFAPDEVEFLPAVNPSKILAIGRNYFEHAAEGGSAPPAAPLVFNKLPNSLSAHEAPILLPTISDAVDYEAELAVVIGRRAKAVSEADALDYVFGYTLINDVTARDLQRGDSQWVRGKGLDSFAPLGPFITTRDEVADVHALRIEGRLNGELMQSSTTAKMIFKVPYLVSYISQGITLEAGDVIATGTPEGVGFFRKPPVLLKDGDVFEVSVERLGTLRNTVRGPRGAD
ncbi:MAG: fumarylacetoacetate hydrolase family protein [Acidobacteriota bacterium]|nr:fumarylacetoacetate hydrolase family protein [Acidobacteriota bacterium]